MSILDKIHKPADRPIVCTVLGDAGTGKTSLAATFPNPVFIRAEDGLQAIPLDDRPDALPVVTDVAELWDQLGALIKEEHDYKTVVIDSVTALERLFGQHIIDSDPKKPKSLNQAIGGYGAGFQAVSTLHQRVRKAAELLANRGIHVVFIAHADLETIDLPDQEPHSRYSLRLHKRSVAPYVNDVDAVLHVRLKTYVMGEEGKRKAISDGTRIVVCHAAASSISKNRYRITEELPFELGANPLAPYVPTLQADS